MKRKASTNYMLGDGFKAKRRNTRATKGPASFGRKAYPKSSLRRAVQSLEEKKVVDTATAVYACSTTGTVTALNLAAQGTDYTQRVGRKTTNVAVQLEGYIQPEDTTTNNCKSRVLLIYDGQPNGALATIADIFTAATANAFMNLNNRDRFRVLADVNCALGGISSTATQSYAQSPSVHNVSIYRKINLDTIWNNTTGVIASVGTGALLLVTIGDQAAGVATNFVGAARVRFVDA